MRFFSLLLLSLFLTAGAQAQQNGVTKSTVTNIFNALAFAGPTNGITSAAATNIVNANALVKASNLIDLPSPSISRSNLFEAKNLISGATSDSSAAYTFDLSAGQSYVFVSTNGDQMVDGDGSTAYLTSQTFTPVVATGMQLFTGLGISKPVLSQILTNVNLSGSFRGDGRQLGGVVQSANNGSDFADISITRSNIGVPSLAGASYGAAISNGTPSSVGQPAVAYTGGTAFMVVSGSTAKGDYKHALAFPGGVTHFGDANGLGADLTESVFHLGFGASGQTGSSDTQLSLDNGASSPYNSGASFAHYVKNKNALTGEMSTSDPVGSQFVNVPPDRISSLIPGYSELVFNSGGNTNMNGFAICSPAMGGFSGDFGNFSLLTCDFKAKKTRIGVFVSGIYQPTDKCYKFTVSGVTTAPVWNTLYTNNGAVWTIISNSISGGSGSVWATTSFGGSPSASGTLGRHPKNIGAGDASVSFSAAVLDRVWVDAFVVDPVTATTTISNLTVTGTVTGISGGGSGGTNATPITLSISGGNVAVNCTTPVGVSTNSPLAFELTLTGNVTISNPTGSFLNGQRINLYVQQDGTGGRTVSFGNKFVYGSTVTGFTMTSTASKEDHITAVYRSVRDVWMIDGVTQGY